MPRAHVGSQTAGAPWRSNSNGAPTVCEPKCAREQCGATPNQAIWTERADLLGKKPVKLIQKSPQEAVGIMTAGAKKSEKSNF